MNKLKIFLGTLVACLALSAPSYGKTVTAASCAQAAVQTAINSTSPGDTVIVPSGSATWNGLSFGQITLSSNGCVIGESSDSNIPVEMDLGGQLTQLTGFTFSATIQAIFINVDGNGAGLITGNAFIGGAASEMIHNLGLGPSSAVGWTDTVVPGGPNMLYVENNTFKCGTGCGSFFFGTSAIQSYYGARTVFRHNTLTDTQVDQHGTAGNIGARWWEIYDNAFITTSGENQSNYMALRAGSGVVFDNTQSGPNSGGGSIELIEEDSGYPALYQIGRGINELYSPAYIWGNSSSMDVGSGSSNVVLGRDFFVSTTQPATMLRCQETTDVGTSSSCSTTYTYVPYTYPYPAGGVTPPPPVPHQPVSMASLPGGKVGVAYSAGPTVTADTPPVIWAVTPNPTVPGLSFNTATGILSGTPTTVGSFPMTFQVTDSYVCGPSDPSGCTNTSAPVSTSVVINAAPPAAPTSPAAATLGTTVTVTWSPSPSTGVTCYNVYRNNADVGPCTQSPFTDSNLAAGTYTYFVTAVASGSESVPSATSTATIAGPPPPPGCTGETLFPIAVVPTLSAKTPTDINELGVKITFGVAGTIFCGRFYKVPSDTHTTHTYAFWSSTGALLASGTSTGETASGWQNIPLAAPIAIAAGQVITFGVNTGSPSQYADTQAYFTKIITAGDLTTPANAGVYNPGTTSTNPMTVYNASNYWRDVFFTAGSAPPPPITVTIAPTSTSVVTGGTVQFTDTISNDPSNGGVTWSANAPKGLFTAGAPGTATVIVTSVTDPTKSASAVVTITAPPLAWVCVNNQCVATGGTSGQKVTTQLNPPNGPTGTVTLP